MSPSSPGSGTESPPPEHCIHCQTRIDPSRRALQGNPARFCCDGCEAVHAILQGAGLAEYYSVKASLGGITQPALVSDASFQEMDVPSFLERYARPTPQGTLQVQLFLEGVHCAACVWLIEKVPSAVPGCVSARLDFSQARATLEWAPEKVTLSTLARFLASIGYRPHPWRTELVGSLERQETRRLWMRIGVAAACTMNIMFFAIALYAGEGKDLDPRLEQWLRWGSLLAFLPSLLWCAQPFFVGALASIRTGVLHMDLPLALGISVGFTASAWRTIQGAGDIYFDSLAMLITLLLVARWLQRRGQKQARDAAALLSALTASTARVVKDGRLEPVPVETLGVGMEVEVRSGESIPADGVVLEGASHVDYAILSGESAPVMVESGERVFAGGVNLQSSLRIRLEATGEETRVGRLMRLMEEASARRAPIVQMADRITGYFVTTVLALSVLTGLAWSFFDGQKALENVVALLIVTCPCALGMATPVALSVAIGRAARRGILIKGGDTIERLAGIRHMVLDKTGTLTSGRLDQLSWTGSSLARKLLVSAEKGSNHPLARAVQTASGRTESVALEQVKEVMGGGIQARWMDQEVRVGAPRFVLEPGTRIPPELEQELNALVTRAETPVLVALDDTVIGVAGFGDPPRSDTPAALAALTASGITAEVLSGDHPAVVKQVGKALGFPEEALRGAQSPESKLERVEALTRTSATAMVGDGVNDAAALGAATVGIAVHGGAEASLAAADIFLSRPGLMPVAESLEGARATLRIIRRNLIFSAGYNVLGAALAMSGLMNPLLAAVLMPFSSLTVVISSLTGGGFRGAIEPGSTPLNRAPGQPSS